MSGGCLVFKGFGAQFQGLKKGLVVENSSVLGLVVQVCNLTWSKNVNEIVSTHGYSQNQIIVWRYPTMTKASL